MAEKAEVPFPSKLFLRLWLPLARVVGALLFFLLGTLKVRGAYRVPRRGPLIVLANHLADVDPPVVQFACPRHLRFMGKSELFEMKIVGPLMRFFGAFAVKRGEPDRASIRLAVDFAKSGQAVCVFPEGQLSEDGELQELKGGVALIIRLAQCPVICLGLKGTNKVMPYGTRIPRPAIGQMEAVWGEPREFAKEATTEEIIDWVRGQFVSLTG